MAFTGYESATWKVVGHSTKWQRETNDAGQAMQRRVLTARVYKEADAWSTAQAGSAFTGLAATVTGLQAYVGESGPSGSAHLFTFGGEWDIENCDVDYVENIARITMDISRGYSTWQEVPAADYTTTTTGA